MYLACSQFTCTQVSVQKLHIAACLPVHIRAQPRIKQDVLRIIPNSNHTTKPSQAPIATHAHMHFSLKILYSHGRCLHNFPHAYPTTPPNYSRFKLSWEAKHKTLALASKSCNPVKHTPISSARAHHVKPNRSQSQLTSSTHPDPHWRF